MTTYALGSIAWMLMGAVHPDARPSDYGHHTVPVVMCPLAAVEFEAIPSAEPGEESPAIAPEGTVAEEDTSASMAGKTSQRKSWMRYAAIGLAAGAGVGALAGYWLENRECVEFFTDDVSHGGCETKRAVALGALLGAGIGLALGTLVGLTQ